MQDPSLSERDLDQTMQRALAFREEVPPLTPGTARQYVAYHTDDVPRLVAEVRRLRAELPRRGQ
ncbi:MAG TPA: hypothetical protein VK066_10120 [Chloroflexota bacterium]|nr:hypothetical protein [Chloroflexota bacterium]